MISPELLRRYPFFGDLDDAQLKAVAMVTEEKSFSDGAVIFKEDTPANAVYVVIEGEVDLVYSGGGEGAIVNAPVGSIAAGEIFGVSSLVEPHRYIDTAKCARATKVISIDANALRACVHRDGTLGHTLVRRSWKSAIERLRDTKIELAAAQSRRYLL